MTDYKYRVIRSNRKTIRIQIDDNGITVRAPRYCTDLQIKEVLSHHENWIEKHFKIYTERHKNDAQIKKLTEEELNELANKAREYIPKRVQLYAEKMGVTYGKITIRNQRTRWGSCSEKGNLNFNCLLMLTPAEVIDSVIVHELCHRREMNHSDKFYAEVLRAFPDYYKWDKWLKENGSEIIRRGIS